MGCCNSTQAGEQPTPEVNVKHIEGSQHSDTSSNSVSTVPHISRQPPHQEPGSTTQPPDTRHDAMDPMPVGAGMNGEDNSPGNQRRAMEPQNETAEKTEEQQPGMTCQICYEKVDRVTKPCDLCSIKYCNDCLRHAFMGACKDETMMPPFCCRALNIGVAASVLTPEEMDLYKRKYEEWNTADRVYCPVPTCSAFIPYRLFPEGFSPPTQKKGKNRAQQAFIGPQLQPPLVACPSCTAHICCSCKQLSHSGLPCPKKADELDPGLEELFKRWKIKRCPKCRAPVRKMYGCSYVICRCGGQWCFACGQYMDLCEEEGACDGEETDYDDEEENDENENGDGFVDLDEEASPSGDYGPDPEGRHRDPNFCHHNWTEEVGRDVPAPGEEERLYQCNRCWRTVSPALSVYPELGGFLETGTITEASTTGDGRPLDPYSDADYGVFICRYCSLTLCRDCRHKGRGRARYDDNETSDR